MTGRHQFVGRAARTSSRRSPLHTVAPERHPRDADVLYSENLHVKALIKTYAGVFVLALLPVALLIGYFVAASALSGLTVPGTTLKGVDMPPLNPILVIAVFVLWYAVCAYLIVRALYKWRHTVIELTTSELAVLRPRNLLLFLNESERDAIRTESLVGFRTERATLSELLFFHRSITASVEISNVEGNKKSPVDMMADVRDYQALGSAIRSLQPRRTVAGK